MKERPPARQSAADRSATRSARRAAGRRACWFCGYDLRGAVSTLCPECGNDQRDAPAPHRVRHSGAIFACIVGFIVLTGVTFAISLSLAAPMGYGGTWTEVIAVLGIASIDAAWGLRLLFFPPRGVDERSTTRTACWVALVSIIAAGAVVLLL